MCKHIRVRPIMTEWRTCARDLVEFKTASLPNFWIHKITIVKSLYKGRYSPRMNQYSAKHVAYGALKCGRYAILAQSMSKIRILHGQPARNNEMAMPT